MAIVTQALLVRTWPRFMIVLEQHDNMTNRHRLPVHNYLAQKQIVISVIRRAASKNYQVSKIRVTF